MVKPILYVPEMVQAILDNRKKQTRRIIKEMDGFNPNDFVRGGQGFLKEGFCFLLLKTDFEKAIRITPKYQVGDILWVRESATVYKIEGTTGFHFSGEKPVKSIRKIGIEYCDGERVELAYPERLSLNIKCGQKLPYGIFKEAARIFLKVTNVRVERLQDISEEDAIAEGIERYGPFGEFKGEPHPGGGMMRFRAYSKAARAFEDLWNSINAKKYP